MKSRFAEHDMGDGFYVTSENRRTWTEYTAEQVDDNGKIVGGRVARFCRRREADEQVAKWKAEDAS